jgi:hypothetical protein
MVSEATIEAPRVNELAVVILEDRSGEFADPQDRQMRRLESECGDELFPAMAWI